MAKDIKKFPDESSFNRLRGYGVYEKLLQGNHYSAYMTDIGEKFSDKYSFLRYMTCNFAGLMSKVMADVLFGEKAVIEATDKNKEAQTFIDALVHENRLDTQLYESSLMNSARGDALLRVRIEEGQIIVEDINPAMYFVKDNGNFRVEPDEKILAWKEEYEVDGKPQVYLIQEKYTKGLIETSVYMMKAKDGQEVSRKVAVNTFNEITGNKYIERVETGIDKIPLIHIPNFRSANTYWGTSDYQDLESLFFAINNRMTKIDNILDKHSDPILTVPEGVLDENGNVEKKALGMIEVRGGEGKPEYIVWNANLDSAFKQIDEIVKMIFLFGEVSPDVLGLDTGRTGAESGRALKIRMIRTLAKKNRKALYYELGIQKAVEIASLYAKLGNKVGDVGYKGEPIIPNVTFADGIVDDKVEEIENEVLKVENGLTSKKRAIKVIEDMDDKEADKLLDEIRGDNKDKADFSIDNLFHNESAVANQNINKEAKENEPKGTIQKGSAV